MWGRSEFCLVSQVTVRTWAFTTFEQSNDLYDIFDKLTLAAWLKID